MKKNYIKNTYEDQLFKIEDERFEIDVSIERFKAVRKWLEKMADPQTSDQVAITLLEKIKKFPVIEIIYGTRSSEMFNGLKVWRRETASKIMERINEKLEVIKDTKSEFERGNWAQVADTCFHRSLDRKSFSIKYYDRKMALNKSISIFTQIS